MTTYTGYKQYPAPADSVGLPAETIMSLSHAARELYNNIFDYCTYAADPQYHTLHAFRARIAHMENAAERDILIAYFNADPAIHDHNMTVPAYEYFAAPYWTCNVYYLRLTIIPDWHATTIIPVCI